MIDPKKEHSDTLPDSTQLSDDHELWELLSQGSHYEASPFFSRNVMREIRLDNDSSRKSRNSFLSLVKTPKFAMFASVALITILAVNSLIVSKSEESNHTSNLSHTQELQLGLNRSSLESNLELFLESELLLAAVEEPHLFSDEEVIAMLF